MNITRERNVPSIGDPVQHVFLGNFRPKKQENFLYVLNGGISCIYRKFVTIDGKRASAITF